MAETITPKMGLTKPEIGASNNTWGNLLNTNFDLIDVKAVRNSIQWTTTPGDDNPASAAGHYVIKRFNNAGVEIDAANPPISINRQTGDMTVQALNTKNLSVTGNISATGTITGSFVNVAASGAISGASLAVTGAISGASLNVSGNVNSASVSGGVISGSSLAVGGAISGNTLAANGANIGGTTSVGRINASNSVRSDNGHVFLNTAENRYLNFDGTNYNLAGTHLFTAAGRVWGSNDFNMGTFQPAGSYQPAGAYVTSGRLEFAADQVITYNVGVVEPHAGGVMTGMGLATSSPVFNTVRWRRMQLFNGGWFTVGYV